jgi:hypothetical protein
MALDLVREIALSDSSLFIDNLPTKYFSTDLDNSVELYKELNRKVKEQLIKSAVSEDIMKSKDFKLIIQNTYFKKSLPKSEKCLLYDTES